METISEYEVRCARCDVSFPVSTKRCMHCGGKTGPSVLRVPGFDVEFGAGQSEGVTRSPESARGGGRSMRRPFRRDTRSELPPDLLSQIETEEEEEGARRPSILRSMSTIIWIALAILFSVMRVCSEG